MEKRKEKKQVQVKVKFFDVPLEECIERDLKRPNSVGSKVIIDMYNTYIKKEKGKKNLGVEVLKQDNKLPHAIIVDLDGTLAIMNNRKPYEYDKVDKDLLNETIDQVVFGYCEGQYQLHNIDITIIYLSGREDICKDKTLKWLKKHKHCLNEKDLLLMRKEGDYRKDHIVKKEIFDNKILNKYYIDLVLDDRLQVCRMWREIGLTCLQVADGNF